MLVSNFLLSVKAHKGIYYNLDEKTKKEYQKLYSYLVSNKDKEIYSIMLPLALKQNPHRFGTFLYKYWRMQTIAQNIKH